MKTNNPVHMIFILQPQMQNDLQYCTNASNQFAITVHLREVANIEHFRFGFMSGDIAEGIVKKKLVNKVSEERYFLVRFVALCRSF